VIFCSDPMGVKDSYLRYLEKRLRDRFGLAGSPIRIGLRGRREKSRARRPRREPAAPEEERGGGG
jgi:predicted GTPase